MSRVPPMHQGLAPHRGAVILVLGILSFVVPCGGLVMAIIAWMFANTDLAKMANGEMDSSGRGLTQAGKILGIVNVALTVVGVVLWLFWMVVIVGVMGAAAAGAAGAGGP